MFAKILVIVAVAVCTSSAGVVPFAPGALVAPAPYAIAPYASSYTAHTVNHAIAAPVFAPAPVFASAPIVAPAPLAAPSAPIFAGPSPYLASARYLSAPALFR